MLFLPPSRRKALLRFIVFISSDLLIKSSSLLCRHFIDNDNIFSRAGITERSHQYFSRHLFSLRSQVTCSWGSMFADPSPARLVSHSDVPASHVYLELHWSLLPQMIASQLTLSPSLCFSGKHTGCQKLQTHSLTVSSPLRRKDDSWPVSQAKVLG